MGDPRWNELENAIPSLAAMYPEATKVKVQPMGWFEKYVLGGKRNVATTDMDGTINYNKEAAMRDQINPDQLLAHELQHVRQNNSRGVVQNAFQRVKQGMLPWESRPDEIEAMAAENPVRGFRRTADIQLKQEAQPASLQGLIRGTNGKAPSGVRATAR